MKKRISPRRGIEWALAVAAGAFAAILILSGTFWIFSAQTRADADAQRIRADRERDLVSGRISLVLTDSLEASWALELALKANPGLSGRDFDRVASSIIGSRPAILGMALGRLGKPDVAYLWGAASALPDFSAGKVSRKPTVSAPAAFADGTRAIVERRPLDLGTGEIGSVATIISIDAVLQDAGFRQEDGEFVLSLRTAPENDLPVLLAGSEEGFRGDPSAVTITAGDISWDLAVKPRSGWAGPSALTLLMLWSSFLISALLGILTFMLIRSLTRFKRQATHDHLTGLANSRHLAERFDAVLKARERDGKRGALLFVDLDDFKGVNDSFGHQAGDYVLQEASARIKRAFRDTDVVARLGGDEFAVLVPAVEDAGALEQIAKRLIASISQPISWRGQEARIGLSLGAVVFPDAGTDREKLISLADSAMYESKLRGKGCYTIHEKA